MAAGMPIEPERRLWLASTSLLGGAGLAASALPFVTSLAPSERARAIGAAVHVDLSTQPAGELRTVQWRGKPIFVLRRSPSMLAALDRHIDRLADPASQRSGADPSDGAAARIPVRRDARDRRGRQGLTAPPAVRKPDHG